MQGLHIGIIMDGNRRFAKRLMKNPSMGHKWGAEKLSNLIGWCKELNIAELTLYTLSLQNFNRPKEEFDYLMHLFRDHFDKIKDDKRIYINKIKVKVLGRIHLLPEDIQKKIKEIEEKTKDHDSYQINFAIAYGGREEITDAMRRIAEKIEKRELKSIDINQDTIKENLYSSNEPDLIIRTGGDHRTSNFLPFQSTYSEWFFIEKMWPEFEKEDFIKIIDQFKSRERRFGK